MIVKTLSLPSSSEKQVLSLEPLSRAAYAPFGDVVENPAPDSCPSNTNPKAIARGALPCGAISANQGTAIQYTDIASMRDLYTAGASNRATPRMTMFVCGARDPGADGEIPVKVLERHPFTTQTFIPLTASGSKRYLVVVAPSLPPSSEDEGLPVPTTAGGVGKSLPGRGLPDLKRLRAFVATGEQAVTYGPGTWHAPMIALGPPGSSIDFIVVQFANDVPVENCQEVALQESRASASGIVIRIPKGLGMEKGVRLTKL